MKNFASANLDNSAKGINEAFGEGSSVNETTIMSAGVNLKKFVYDKSLKAQTNFESEKNSIEQIRDGIMLNIIDFIPNENMEFSFTGYHSPTFIKIVLSANCKIDYVAHKKNVYEYTESQVLFGKNINSSGTFYLQKRTPFQMITIELSDEAIATLAHNCEKYETLIKKMTPQNEGFSDMGHYKIYPQLNIAARQIMSCPKHMTSRKLYLESKILEILALQFEKLIPCQKSRQKITKSDIERIHAAKDILFANIVSSPSLIELSRKVGTNDFTLKKGFKEVFGNTVYGLLREYRMQKAKELLLDGEHDISTVADLVGYSSSSHLTVPFTRYHGVTPGEMLRSGHSLDMSQK